MPLLLVFIDGIGLGAADLLTNPFNIATMPFVRSLLAGQPLNRATVGPGIVRPGLVVRSLDVLMGVPGLPQSATGQAALLTGVNAARLAGRHVNGFPNKVLRELLSQSGIFKLLNQAGRNADYANTFSHEYFESVRQGKWRHAAATVAALAGGCRLHLIEELLARRSIFHDLTNQELQNRGYQVPLFEPEEAAGILARQAAGADFTFFEYFQTDHCGHARDQEWALLLLNQLDRFLAGLDSIRSSFNLTLMVTSDHGNLEDLSIRTHTMNPIPLLVSGPGTNFFQSLNRIMEIVPAVQQFFGLAPLESTSPDYGTEAGINDEA